MPKSIEARCILERTARGCASTKANGVKFGGKPKCTPYQRRAARAELDAGETQRSVTPSYNLNYATISRLAG